MLARVDALSDSGEEGPQDIDDDHLEGRPGRAGSRKLSFEEAFGQFRAMVEHQCDPKCRRACFLRMRDAAFVQAGAAQLQHFSQLHKLDQDRVIYDYVRIRWLTPGARRGSRMTYSFLDRPICEVGCVKLLRIAKARFRTLKSAAIRGVGPPVDMRYIERPMGGGPCEAQVTSYLEELYESVAEVLPEDTQGSDVVWQETPLFDVGVAEVGPAPEDRRYLPPGTITSLWEEHSVLRPEHKVSRASFYGTFGRFGKLGFRQKRQHKTCGTCVRHKLIIKNLGGDLHKRKMQIGFYHKHLRSQRMDRGVYYVHRALSRLRGRSQDGRIHISMIYDGMDQAKFNCPRDERLDQSKEMEGVRPRLHVTGLIVHGYFRCCPQEPGLAVSVS
jgi:hypothetical protein